MCPTRGRVVAVDKVEVVVVKVSLYIAASLPRLRSICEGPRFAVIPRLEGVCYTQHDKEP